MELRYGLCGKGAPRIVVVNKVLMATFLTSGRLRVGYKEMKYSPDNGKVLTRRSKMMTFCSLPGANVMLVGTDLGVAASVYL